MYRARIDSPLGPILLCAGEKGLAGLYFIDQKDCPLLPDGPGARPDSIRPASGRINGVALRILRPVPRSCIPGEGSAQIALFPDDLPPYDRQAGQTARADQNTPSPNPHPLPPPGKNAAALELLQEATPTDVAGLFKTVHAQLCEYFSQSRTDFSFPLDLAGTPFQTRVWQALCQVPYGRLTSYGELAAMAGFSAGHGRAVGSAVGRNPVSIVVPCHRIIGSNQTLTGYTGGLPRKLALLELEGFTFL